MDALEEQLRVVRGHWAPGPFSFEGEYFRAEDLDALPKPVQSPLPLILGGRGGPRSLRLAARYADEYNTVMATAEEVADIRPRLDRACDDRDPASLPFSMMTGWLVAPMPRPARARLVPLELAGRERRRRRVDCEHVREHDRRHGGEAIERLRQLEAAGLTRLMAQHLLHRDLAAVALLGDEVIPALAR